MTFTYPGQDEPVLRAVDLRDIDPLELRHRFGVLFQDFAGTS